MSGGGNPRNNSKGYPTMGTAPSKGPTDDVATPTLADSVSATKGTSHGSGGNKPTQSGGKTHVSATRQNPLASTTTTAPSTSRRPNAYTTTSPNNQVPLGSSTGSSQETTPEPYDDVASAANRPIPDSRNTHSTAPSSQRGGLAADTVAKGNQTSGNHYALEDQLSPRKTQFASSGSSSSTKVPSINRSERSTNAPSKPVPNSGQDVLQRVEVVEDSLEDVLRRVEMVETLRDQVKQQKYALQEAEKSAAAMQQRLRELEDNVQCLFQRLEEGRPLPSPSPPPQQQQQQQRPVESVEAPTEAQLIEILGGALGKRFAQLEGTLQKQFERLEGVLQQQFGQLWHVNVQALQERKHEQEDTAITTIQGGTMSPEVFHTEGRVTLASPASLPPARKHVSNNHEFEISDRDVEQSFQALNSSIFDLAHKCLDDPKDTLVKTIKNEPWARALTPDIVLKNKGPWLRRQIANIIYGKLFRVPFFAFDDEEVEKGLVKFENWLASKSFGGNETEAARWPIQTARIAENQHRKRGKASETEITKLLAEKITMSFPFKTGENANRVLRRVCHEAVACALLLRSSRGYSWEHQDDGAASQASVKVGDVQQIGPYLIGQDAVGGSGKHKVAFTVFGAVIKDYFTIVEERPVRGRAVIVKPSVVLH